MRYTLDEICISLVRGPFGSALKKEYFVELGENTYKVYEQGNAIRKSVGYKEHIVQALHEADDMFRQYTQYAGKLKDKTTRQSKKQQKISSWANVM